MFTNAGAFKAKASGKVKVPETFPARAVKNTASPPIEELAAIAVSLLKSDAESATTVIAPVAAVNPGK